MQFNNSKNQRESYSNNCNAYSSHFVFKDNFLYCILQLFLIGIKMMQGQKAKSVISVDLQFNGCGELTGSRPVIKTQLSACHESETFAQKTKSNTPWQFPLQGGSLCS